MFTVGGKADLTRRRGEREELEGTASLVAAWKARYVAPLGERTLSNVTGLYNRTHTSPITERSRSTQIQCRRQVRCPSLLLSCAT